MTQGETMRVERSANDIAGNSDITDPIIDDNYRIVGAEMFKNLLI